MQGIAIIYVEKIFYNPQQIEMSIRKKILVIEDDDIIRDNLISLLELKDYDARSAENGKEGIDKAFTFNPDLIL